MEQTPHQHHGQKGSSHVAHNTASDPVSPEVHGGHDKHAGHHTQDFLTRFWVCLVVTVPVLLLSPMIQSWLGYSLRFPGDIYVLLALGAFIYFYGGLPFLKGMISEIRDRAIGMMTLVALAISVAFFYSVAVVFGLRGMDFFWELATLIDIMLLGHWLEMRSQTAASNALQSLVALLPSQVHLVETDGVRDIELIDLHNNDIVLVKPGEKMPADGHVVAGESFVDESMLTGESVPVRKTRGDRVIAGAINGDGALRLHVTGAGADSYLNKVIALVQSAQNAKSATQNLADRVAKWLTFISIIVGVGTFLFWYLQDRNLAFALERLVTVMVTSCPHALGVAIPLVVAISTTRAAISGLLIRNRTAFENARKLTTVIFDKTGTLTKGSHEVQQVLPANESINAESLLQLAASAQQNSEHYIARGMLRALKQQNIALLPSSGFRNEQGAGVEATVAGKKIAVGGPNYFGSRNSPVPAIPSSVDQAAETVSFVLIDGTLAGYITLADSIRETAPDAIRHLKSMGIRSFLLTGDNEQVAASVAQKLHMDGFMANVLPHQKQERLQSLQQKGEIVAMTGDGVNDAPALAQADVGIAVGSGTDVAAETADIILVNSDPQDVVNMIAFGRATYRKMKQNLFWAVGYNLVAIPLAAGVLYPKFMLSPAMGAVLMSLSTIVVAFNAQLLRRQFHPVRHQDLEQE
ncbi:heavy metal translocating P-type ATPase [Flaviaesturariibacter flavus]|uniref:Heavy metal translocating P-type ATPase n=1 Tax=Flaviaesturariibacter flavus TaxID=2502780 RepID=A0A4R1B8C3_9BACT|nr:heavy metal translocating P-type ATPase [Flaviaesturariibacter flavus]TCJ12139.1 heavy metal translocating P-type ATPase [Flaviaesturariibacter flavus]